MAAEISHQLSVGPKEMLQKNAEGKLALTPDTYQAIKQYVSLWDIHPKLAMRHLTTDQAKYWGNTVTRGGRDVIASIQEDILKTGLDTPAARAEAGTRLFSEEGQRRTR